MVKVVYLPVNGAVEQTGMYDAFKQAGVQLTIFDYYRMFINKKNKAEIKKSFLNTIKQTQPDLLHMQLQFFDIIDSSDLINAKKESPHTIITDWTGDIVKDVPWTFAEHSKGTDISLISSVGQLELYKKHCFGDVRYWQIGYNPKLYFPKKNTQFKYDISFVASKYRDNIYPDAALRTKIVGYLNKELGSSFGLFGNRWGGHKSVAQSKVNDIYNDSFAVLSVNNFNDVEFYFSDRLLMAMASGRPVISYRFPGWDSYFSHMKNIIIVYSKEEILEKLKWLKDNKEAANKIGMAGHDIVFREHTYFCRTLELLKMVGLL